MRLVRLAVAGALAASIALPAAAQAMTCGDLSWACSTVCNSTGVTRKVCSQLN